MYSFPRALIISCLLFLSSFNAAWFSFSSQRRWWDSLRRLSRLSRRVSCFVLARSKLSWLRKHSKLPWLRKFPPKCQKHVLAEIKWRKVSAVLNKLNLAEIFQKSFRQIIDFKNGGNFSLLFLRRFMF